MNAQGMRLFDITAGFGTDNELGDVGNVELDEQV